MNLPFRVVLISIFTQLTFVSNEYGKGKVNFDLQIKTSLKHVEVNITKESLDGYVVWTPSYGVFLSLITKNLQFGISYDRFSYNRSFTGRMVGEPWEPPLPVEKIDEYVTSNTLDFNVCYRWPNITKIFIPYLGCGIKLNFLASKKIGQTTHLYLTSNEFWYPGLSILGEIQFPITHHIYILSEVSLCALGSSSFIKAYDAYMPAYHFKVNSISFGIGYRF